MLVASFVSFALLPGLLDVINSIAGAGPIATFDPVRDFALLPHLPLLVILFSYFQGAMLKARRWTTAAVLGCGLAMIFAVPGLCLGADWELARFGRLIPITLRDITILGTYFGLYVVAGAVVVVGAWRELKRLSPTGRPLR